MPYHEGDPTPAGYTLDEEVRRAPVIGGLITLGVPYLLGLLIAAQEGYNNMKGFLVIPGVGPWLTLIARDSSCDPNLAISNCDEDSAARFALVLDGLLQTTGGVLTAYGFLNTRKRYVRSDWTPQVSITPRWVGRGVDISFAGAF